MDNISPTFVTIAIQTIGLAFWLGILSADVKALKLTQEKKPSLSDINTALQVLSNDVKHLTELLEAHNIKPRGRANG